MIVQTGATLGGRYTLGSVIAAGGMGVVWEATDVVLQRPVAVKIVRPPAPEDDAFIERFRDEARGSASLHHPNIAAVFDYGEEDGTAYLVLELVPGRTVSELVRDNPRGMPADDVRSILGQAALALSVAHEAGVVHRDVKPANIIVTPEGQAKLTDFGIARLGDGSGHTMTGEVLGTPEYISPEQALGEPATAASDIYSLGIVTYEMLTGRRPFDQGSPVATALAQVNDPPPALPEAVPADLRAVVEASLAKTPADRPVDARAIAEAVGVSVGVLPAADPTRSLPVTLPTRAATRRASATARRRSGDPVSRPRWAWLAVPAVALVTWAAFALGSVVDGSSPTATPSKQASTSAPAPSSSSPTATTPTRTTPTRTTTDTPRATSRPTTTTSPVQSVTQEPTKPGKGKGKGGKAK